MRGPEARSPSLPCLPGLARRCAGLGGRPAPAGSCAGVFPPALPWTSFPAPASFPLAATLAMPPRSGSNFGIANPPFLQQLWRRAGRFSEADEHRQARRHCGRARLPRQVQARRAFRLPHQPAGGGAGLGAGRGGSRGGGSSRRCQAAGLVPSPHAWRAGRLAGVQQGRAVGARRLAGRQMGRFWRQLLLGGDSLAAPLAFTPRLQVLSPCLHMPPGAHFGLKDQVRPQQSQRLSSQEILLGSGFVGKVEPCSLADLHHCERPLAAAAACALTPTCSPCLSGTPGARHPAHCSLPLCPRAHARPACPPSRRRGTASGTWTS